MVSPFLIFTAVADESSSHCTWTIYSSESSCESLVFALRPTSTLFVKVVPPPLVLVLLIQDVDQVVQTLGLPSHRISEHGIKHTALSRFRDTNERNNAQAMRVMVDPGGA